MLAPHKALGVPWNADKSVGSHQGGDEPAFAGYRQSNFPAVLLRERYRQIFLAAMVAGDIAPPL